MQSISPSELVAGGEGPRPTVTKPRSDLWHSEMTHGDLQSPPATQLVKLPRTGANEAFWWAQDARRVCTPALERARSEGHPGGVAAASWARKRAALLCRARSSSS